MKTSRYVARARARTQAGRVSWSAELSVESETSQATPVRIMTSATTTVFGTTPSTSVPIPKTPAEPASSRFAEKWLRSRESTSAPATAPMPSAPSSTP